MGEKILSFHLSAGSIWLGYMSCIPVIKVGTMDNKPVFPFLLSSDVGHDHDIAQTDGFLNNDFKNRKVDI